jgi:ribosome-associated toxin RatA of RatAB toxin-antitoxin module
MRFGGQRRHPHQLGDRLADGAFCLLSAEWVDIQRPKRLSFPGMKQLNGHASGTVAAPIERCFDLLVNVDRYPSWYPDVVKSVEVLERDSYGRPTKARAKLHVAYGPVTRDFDLIMNVQADPYGAVTLTRIPHEPTDAEKFQVAWKLREGSETRIDLDLTADLPVPRFLPVGGIGDGLAQGFVTSAVRALR